MGSFPNSCTSHLQTDIPSVLDNYLSTTRFSNLTFNPLSFFKSPSNPTLQPNLENVRLNHHCRSHPPRPPRSELRCPHTRGARSSLRNNSLPHIPPASHRSQPQPCWNKHPVDRRRLPRLPISRRHQSHLPNRRLREHPLWLLRLPARRYLPAKLSHHIHRGPNAQRYDALQW